MTNQIDFSILVNTMRLVRETNEKIENLEPDNPTIMYAERLLKSKYMFWRRENRVEKENSLKLSL